MLDGIVKNEKYSTNKRVNGFSYSKNIANVIIGFMPSR